MSLQISRLSHALGAEVTGVDVGSLDDATFSRIHQAFLEHHVLVFRGRRISREAHVAFSRRFGNLDLNASTVPERKPPGFPELLMVVSRPKPNGEAATGRFSGQEWHTDHSHRPAAAAASLLRAVEIPPLGGDTMFCNMYRAYESLSDGMKKMIEGLDGVHMESVMLDYSTPERYAESRRRNPSTAHPVVRVHPETGRKALYVNEQVKIIVGLSADESRPLIQFLTQHAVRPQNVYRHHWQQDDLVMWDNRCLLHIALGDYDRTQVRHMERTTVNGEVSGYAYDGPVE
jgi:taurine dioxygenase